MLNAKRYAPMNPRDKMPLEVTPIYFKLQRYDANPKAAQPATAQPDAAPPAAAPQAAPPPTQPAAGEAPPVQPPAGSGIQQ
jgi:hypothetical protein